MSSARAKALLSAVVLVSAACLLILSASISSADKGGCPNANAANGAAHADPNSAHGAGKQQDRNCAQPTPAAVTPPSTVAPTATPSPTAPPTPTPSPTPSPSPSPTPSPTPVPGTDTKVASVAVAVPQTTTTGVEFMVSGTAGLHNNGSASTVLVDTTFTLTLPAGCVAPVNSLVFTVPNRNLPASIVVNITRNWRVICDAVGDHQFNVGVVTVISPGQPWAESNPANNSGAGAANTFMSAPTPTPSPAP